MHVALKRRPPNPETSVESDDNGGCRALLADDFPVLTKQPTVQERTGPKVGVETEYIVAC